MDSITNENASSAMFDAVVDDERLEPVMLSSESQQVKKKSQKPRTRQSTELFGLGPAISSNDAKITGCRLPSNLQVLRCMMYHCNMAANDKRPGSVGATSRFSTAKIVLEQVTAMYKKANIPVVSQRRGCEKIVKLLDDNNKLRAISKARRNAPAAKKKVEENQHILASTFQLWPPNVETIMKNPEDLKFLHSMKSDRKASFGSFDKLLAQKVARRCLREAAVEKQVKRSRLDMGASTSTCDTVSLQVACENSDSQTVSNSSDSDASEEFIPPSSVTYKQASSKRKRIGTNVFIPPDVLKSPNLVSLATRLKITPTQQAAFTEGLITTTGGDVSMVTSSYATADRARRKVVSDIALNVRSEWIPPKLCTLHWDTKLMTNLQSSVATEDRLTVLVGNSSDMKLLGVPSFKKANKQKIGEIIADLTIKLLKQWNCSNSIVNMTFDTTASNTGHLSASCVAIQEKLKRALLWSSCRHHIGEVLLSHVFNKLKIEISQSPDVTLFKRLRSNWHLLPHSSEQASIFQPSSFSKEAQELLAMLRDETIACAASTKEYVRDDYKECVELSLLFLNASVGVVQFRCPGAMHKARWMSTIIYSLKIALAEKSLDQLPAGTIVSLHQMRKIRDFVIFITHVYCKWWLMCKDTADAPWNDLQLFKNLLQYELVNKEISQAAISAFSRHLWYLTAEMVTLALFSCKVPESERQALADKLLQVQPVKLPDSPQNRIGSGWGKPQWRSSALTVASRLCDFVTIDSWFTVYHLQIDSSFLHLPVAQWETSDAYLDSAQNVKAINVVNDAAERGIKLTSDFLQSARSEQHLQNILQVVEQSRKTTPNLRVKNSKK